MLAPASTHVAGCRRPAEPCQETQESYTKEDSRNICQCSQLQEVTTPSLCRNRKRLNRPEYSLSARVLREGLRLLPCTAAGVTALLGGVLTRKRVLLSLN